MNFDERASNARTDLGTLLDGVGAPPASRIRSVSRRRRALQAGTGALAVAVALGAVAILQRNDPKDPVILTPPSTETTEPAGVTAHLELSTTTVESGGTIDGVLVIENNIGSSGIPDRMPCWQVVLTEIGVPAQAVFSGCASTDLPLGTTRLPFVVNATHSYCGFELPQRRVPACLTDGGLPPFALGEYEAAFVSSPVWTVRPPAVRVTVTEAAPETTTSTTTSVAARPTFPAAVEPTPGGTTWAVVIAGAFVPPGTPLDSDQTLNSAVAVASRGGYTTGPTDCDQGADVAWGASPDATDFYSVSVYFGSEAEARQANEAFKGIGWNSGVVAQLQTFCLD